MKNLAKYNKFIVAIMGAIVTVLIQQYGSSNGVVQAIVPVLTALGVYTTPNAQG